MEALKGVSRGLCYSLRWLTPRPAGTAAEATRGELYLEVDRRPVWGDRMSRTVRGLPWTWVDLLEHLTTQWPALVWEETNPLGLDAAPRKLRRAAESRWGRSKDHDALDREQRALLRFERSHNLAFALGGAAFPALWLLREGGDMVLEGDRWTVRRPFPELKATLESLGDEIAERLAAMTDERAALALKEWVDRGNTPAWKLLSFATGLSRQAIADVQGDRPANDVWGFPEGNLQPTAELAAARMFGNQAPSEVIARTLNWIQSRSVASTPDLDALSRQAQTLSSATSISEHRAYEQGYELASWLRAIPGVAAKSGRVEPHALLSGFGVEATELDLGWSGIEAVACWSAMHGPAILLNLAGKHMQGVEGRRATLAHELCHMLVDRGRSLPLAEVLGGRTPVHAEQRANAFAAELLLPREVAGAAFRGSSDAPRQVAKLRDKYAVSGDIIAWQALRSEVHLSRASLAHLRSLVADPAKFDRAARGR